MVTHIRRRSGEAVPFDSARVARAIFAAAQAVGGSDEAEANRMAALVVDFVNEHYAGTIPDVEKIQDIVEAALIKSGHVTTARAFILYREKRRIEREQLKLATLEKIKNREIEMLLPTGERQKINFEAILDAVRLAADGLKKVDIQAVVEGACKNLYSGVTLREIERSLINAARTRIELHPEYSLLAARLLWQTAYQEVLGTSAQTATSLSSLHTQSREAFSDFLTYGIENDLLDKRLKDFDLAKITAALRPERDLLFHYLGAQTIYDRYLLKTVTRPQRICELPQWMWMRVAMGLALLEHDKEAKAIEFYDVLSQMYFVSSTPTLFNSGTTHSQMSSCYLNIVEDDLNHIFKVIGDNAQLSKWAGGIGTDWTRVRSTNSHIKGTNGASQGIIPFLKIFNDTALAVNQGGKRKGAMCAYLEIWHGDTEEFIEAKKNTGDDRRRLHDVNTALWIPDLFMQRVAAGADWTLFSPSDVPDLHDLYGKAFKKRYEEYEAMNLPSAKRIPALDLWKKALTMLYETGHPWITFKDAANVRNPQKHVGVIHNSNLCTEITLNTSKDETAVCNLGSVNLDRMLDGTQLSKERMASTIRTAMRMLDNVIDLNYYPTEEAKNSNLRHRPVGLGLMGFADLLYQLGLPYDSQEAIALAGTTQELISYYAILASSELARERGTYSTYAGSLWDQGLLPQDTIALMQEERGESIDMYKSETLDWTPVREHIKAHGMRNSNTQAIAPTATISNITGTVPCTEPIFKNIYMKENLSGSFVIINRHLVRDLEAHSLWSPAMSQKIKFYNGSIQQIAEIPDDIKARYKEVFEIDSKAIIRGASARMQWIDQSASTNIFVVTTSGRVLHDIYTLAWKLGLKTTYYCRTLAVSQVEKTIELPIEEQKPVIPAPVKKLAGVEILKDPDCEACQ